MKNTLFFAGTEREKSAGRFIYTWREVIRQRERSEQDTGVDGQVINVEAVRGGGGRREEGESQEGDTKHNNKNQSTVSHSSLTTVSVSQSVDWLTALSSVKLLWNKSVVKLKPPQTHTELRRVCWVCVMTASYSGGAVGYRCVYIYTVYISVFLSHPLLPCSVCFSLSHPPPPPHSAAKTIINYLRPFSASQPLSIFSAYPIESLVLVGCRPLATVPSHTLLLVAEQRLTVPWANQY